MTNKWIGDFPVFKTEFMATLCLDLTEPDKPPVRCTWAITISVSPIHGTGFVQLKLLREEDGPGYVVFSETYGHEWALLGR